MALRAASSSGRAKFTVLWAGLDGQVKKYGAHSVGPVSTRPHHAALRGVAGGGWLSTSTSPPFSARWPLLSDAGSSSSTSRNPPARGSPKILPNSPTPPRRRVRSHGPLQEVGRQLPRWVLLLVRCSRRPQSFTSCWFLNVISVSVIRRSPHRPSLVEMR
jgi:hypothetical protein